MTDEDRKDPNYRIGYLSASLREAERTLRSAAAALSGQRTQILREQLIVRADLAADALRLVGGGL